MSTAAYSTNTPPMATNTTTSSNTPYGDNTTTTTSMTAPYNTNGTTTGGMVVTDPDAVSTMPMEQQTTTTSTTATTYDAAAPSIPVRPVVLASNSADVRTTYVGQPLNNTASFTTNTGFASQPVPFDDNAPLAKPSTGIMHSIKKAMTTGSAGPQDPMLDHADQTLKANVANTRHLQQQLQRYHQAQLALQEATVAVASSFHAVLSDETNPYAATSAELLRLSQQHTLSPPAAATLVDQANAAANEMENSYNNVRNEVAQRRTKASDVEYYVAKVDKLTNEQEQAIANGKADPKQRERLDRNIGKTREIQLEYNTENERLIADINALWRRRILQLGPALTSFISQQQLVYADHAAFYARMASQSQMINAEYAHNTYLSSQSTMLLPEGSGSVDHRELIDRSREMGVRSDVAQHQRQLQSENQRRSDLVSKQGGQLETVAQETIVRSEERMRILKERFVTERVRLRKVVTTEMVTMTVAVRKERIEVDRTPVDGPGIPVTEADSLAETDARNQRRASRGKAGTDPNVDEVETYELVVSEERPRIVTDIVPIERVRLRKLREVRTQTAEMDVRREHIDFQAPVVVPSQQTVVTQVGGLQTVVGQNREGFTDKTGHANVVMAQTTARPGVVQETVTQGGVVQPTMQQGQYRKADIDDPVALGNIGVQQRGQYDGTTTAGQYDSTTTAGQYGSTPGQYDSTTTAGQPYQPTLDASHPYYNPNATTSAYDSTATIPATATTTTVPATSTTTTTTTATPNDQQYQIRPVV